MTDAEILRMKLNLANSALDDKGKEEVLAKTDNFHDVFSLARSLFLLSSGNLTGYILLGCCCSCCIANALGNAV